MPNWTKEQQEAIDLEGKNIIVSAGAGSGKTAVLSERVLRKLKDGVEIDSLLILTFTKAAALEMKERIRKKISKVTTLKTQLDKIDNAYITTFDSYALSIVKRYHYLLNVNKNVKIVSDSIIDLEKDRILEEILENHYIKKDSSFLTLIDDFCTKDDKNIKEAILNISNKMDLIYDKEQYLKNYVDTFYQEEFIDSKIKDYEKHLLSKVHKLSDFVLELEEYVEDDYYEKIKDCFEELFLSSSYSMIKDNIPSLPNLPKNSEEKAKKIKESMTNLLKELTMLTEYSNEEEIKSSIFETKKYADIMISILLEFDKKVLEYKNKYDLYEFTDIAKMAIRILKQNHEIALELKNSFNEILIDEYQDTSDLQDLFISLIENNNVYMVGDIKQSIYRFRNANPNLFKEKYDLYSKKESGIKIDLNKNFRSRMEVLDNINLIFNCIMDNEIGGAEYSKSHQMIFGNRTYLEEGKKDCSNDLEIYKYSYDKNSEYSKEEIEIFLIASDIKKKIESHYPIFDKDLLQIRDIRYQDIAILMDRSTYFHLYKKIFEYFNIPLTVYKDESITNSVDIGIVKNLLALFLESNTSKAFEHAFISIMRSYLVALEDNQIFEYFLNKNFEQSDLMKKVTSIDISDVTIEEWLLEIIDQFHFYEKMISVGEIEKHMVTLDYLVDMAKELSDIGYTIVDFYDYLKEIEIKKYEINYSASLEDNGVKIMTIHKSKGLEFPICYYSGLYFEFNISDLKERFLFENRYGIILPFIDRGIRQTIYKDLLKQDYLIDEISEKIRLFYVALTRTEEKMIMVAPFSESVLESKVNYDVKMGYKSFLDILHSIYPVLSKFIKQISLDQIPLTKEYNFIKKTNYQNKIEKKEEILIVNELELENEWIEKKHFSKSNHKLYRKEEIDNMEFGKRIHSLLEYINFTNPDYTYCNDFEKKKIEAFLKLDIMNHVIQFYKEYEFIYEVNHIEYHGIIDLLLEYKDHYKIVDYKLKSIEEEAYFNQLKGYQKYIESVSNKPVEIYLYSILDEKLEKIS